LRNTQFIGTLCSIVIRNKEKIAFEVIALNWGGAQSFSNPAWEEREELKLNSNNLPSKAEFSHKPAAALRPPETEW
jgi:hypothetical protein